MVSSEKKALIEKINPNKDFILNAFDKVLAFVRLGILPKLMAKQYSKVPLLQTTHAASTSMLTEAVTYASTSPKGSMEKKLYCIANKKSMKMKSAQSHGCMSLAFR